VSVGEVALAAAKAGWTPVSGSLSEVRYDGVGTHPLPLPGTPPRAAATSAKREQERHGE
jgi:hypothetical protein